MASVAAPPTVSPTANMSDVSLTMPEVTTPLFLRTCGCAVGCAWMTSLVACRTHKQCFLSVFAGARICCWVLRCRMAAHSCHGSSHQLDERAAVRMRSVARVCVDIHSSGDERLPVSRTHTLLIEPSFHCRKLACLMMQLCASTRNQHANTLQAHAGHGREAGQLRLARFATVG
jgi:hypothetical protein